MEKSTLKVTIVCGNNYWEGNFSTNQSSIDIVKISITEVEGNVIIQPDQREQLTKTVDFVKSIELINKMKVSYLLDFYLYLDV